MIPIRLDIRSEIHSTDPVETESIEQQVQGRFEDREKHWVLRYIEQPGTVDEVRTTVKAADEKVTVIRQGAVSYRQTYHPGKTTYSRIETPGGTTEMEVRTISYQRKKHEKGGRIRFSFDLRMGAEEMGRYHLDIQWTEVPSEE